MLFFLGLWGEAFKTPHERPGTTCASGQISTGAATRPFYTDAIGAGELAVYFGNMDGDWSDQSHHPNIKYLLFQIYVNPH